MRKITKILAGVSIAITVATLITWRATGGDYYTKFEVIEQVDAGIGKDDPLAGTGFYDNASRTQTVVRPAFRFGLLPTPQRLFDKHALSVVSVAMPFWAALIVLALVSRLRDAPDKGARPAEATRESRRDRA